MIYTRNVNNKQNNIQTFYIILLKVTPALGPLPTYVTKKCTILLLHFYEHKILILLIKLSGA